jgi:hypothetical protein
MMEEYVSFLKGVSDKEVDCFSKKLVGVIIIWLKLHWW